MKRISALVIAVTVALLLASCTASVHPRGSASPSGSAAGAQSGSHPNIVFVLTDDLAWNLVSHMPHVQALQKAGTTMSNNYVVDSLCCPSRSATFTGEYPHNDGVFTNSGSDGGYNAYNKNGDQQKSYALAMQQAGYRTGFMGKYLNGYQPTNSAPPGWNEWDVAGNGYPEFNYTLNQDGTQQRYGHDPKSYLTDVLSAKAGSFIDSSAASGKPFMLEVATFAPHAPYTPAPRHKGAANGVPYPRTSAYDALPSNPPSWLKGRPALTAKQQQRITTAYRKRVAADLATDDMIGHLEQELQAKGIAKNTYIVFSSDNGYHMGEYRLLPGKQTAFDTDIHVPLIVSGPGVPAGKTSDQLTSNIDLAPTFESLAGAKPGSTVDGVSMSGLWHGQRPPAWQQAVLIEHHGPDDARGDPDRQNAKHADPPSYEAIRTATALYVHYADGQQEYYDTAHDPHELINLAAKGIPTALPKALAALEKCHDATACQAAARE
jgi:arylsulfatase A-like enzyme